MSQAASHAPPHKARKSASGPTARKVEMAETNRDIRPERMKPKRTGRSGRAASDGLLGRHGHARQHAGKVSAKGLGAAQVAGSIRLARGRMTGLCHQARP